MLMFVSSTLGFVFNFFVIFVGSFGKFSTSQTLALGELPLHNTTPATIGKLEWLTIVIWTVILLVNSIVLAIACKNAFDNIFSTYDKNLGAYVISTALVLTLSFTYLQLESILEFLVTPTFASIAGGIQILIILLLIISSVIKNKKSSTRITPTKKGRERPC